VFSKEAVLLVIELIFIIFRNENDHDDPYYLGRKGRQVRSFLVGIPFPDRETMEVDSLFERLPTMWTYVELCITGDI
jgi:hypothetical protein